MGWRKILDEYTGGATNTDRVYVGGRGKVSYVVEGVQSGVATPKSVQSVPDGAGGFQEEVADIILISPTTGSGVKITASVTGSLTVPCPGEWFYIAFGTGTYTGLNVWAEDPTV